MSRSIAFFNGVIHTMAGFDAEAILISDGVIKAVGTKSDVEPFCESSTEKIDLKGKTITPGLYDSHMHLAAYGESLASVNLSGCRSVEEIIERGRKFIAEKKIPPGTWIYGRGWDQNYFDEPRLFSRREMDMVSTAHPVIFSRNCHHIIIANSMALELAEVKRGTQIPNVVVEFDTDGEPNGVLRETLARDWFNRYIPLPTAEKLMDWITLASESALRAGLTSVGSDDMVAAASQYDVLEDAYQRLVSAGKLGVRVNEQVRCPDMASFEAFLAKGKRTKYGNDYYKLGPLKLLVDGSFGARTAALREPFSDDLSTRGIMIYEQDELTEMVVRAEREGMQSAVHAIGDRGLEVCLNAVEAATGGLQNDLRHRVVHAQFGDKPLYERMAKLGVIADVQPAFTASDWGMAEARVGKDRMNGFCAWRLMKDAGVVLAGGSDCPVESLDPRWGISASITRRDASGNPAGGFLPQESLSPYEAFEIFTKGSAWTSFEEDVKGTLEVGKMGDMVVFAEDPFKITPEDIAKLPVVMTVVGGAVRYSAE